MLVFSVNDDADQVEVKLLYNRVFELHFSRGLLSYGDSLILRLKIVF